MSSKAVVTTSKFQALYTRFQNSYGNAEGPVIVMYHRMNNVVCVYMHFAHTCWKTSIDVTEANKYLQMFNDPVELIEYYG